MYANINSLWLPLVVRVHFFTDVLGVFSFQLESYIVLQFFFHSGIRKGQEKKDTMRLFLPSE